MDKTEKFDDNKGIEQEPVVTDFITFDVETSLDQSIQIKRMVTDGVTKVTRQDGYILLEPRHKQISFEEYCKTLHITPNWEARAAILEAQHQTAFQFAKTEEDVDQICKIQEDIVECWKHFDPVRIKDRLNDKLYNQLLEYLEREKKRKEEKAKRALKWTKEHGMNS